MLVRRSTLTLLFVAAGVFILGSSFIIYHRPDYIPSKVIPEKWLDWSGLGSDHSGMPLPAGGGTAGGGDTQPSAYTL